MRLTVLSTAGGHPEARTLPPLGPSFHPSVPRSMQHLPQVRHRARPSAVGPGTSPLRAALCREGQTLSKMLGIWWALSGRLGFAQGGARRWSHEEATFALRPPGERPSPGQK